MKRLLTALFMVLMSVLAASCGTAKDLTQGVYDTGDAAGQDLLVFGGDMAKQGAYATGLADKPVTFDRNSAELWQNDPLTLYTYKPGAYEIVSKTLTLAKELYGVGPTDTKAILGILGGLDDNNDLNIEVREARENSAAAISALADGIAIGPKTGRLPPANQKK